MQRETDSGKNVGENLICRGVKTHNLQNIDLDIPLGKWTTVTGVSGSGKSSLVFDTIYAEAQRRFLETLGTYERQFMQGLPQGEFQIIENVPAAVALKQTNRTGDPRSVIGATADVLEPLRTIFVGLMAPSCANCGSEVAVDTVEDFIAFLQSLGGQNFKSARSDKDAYAKKKTSNKVASQSNEYGVAGIIVAVQLQDISTKLTKEFFKMLMAEGYYRLLVDNKISEIEEFIESKEFKFVTENKNLSIVLDRIFMEDLARFEGIGSEVGKEILNRAESIWSQVRYSERFQKISVYFFNEESNILLMKNRNFNVTSYCRKCQSVTQLIQLADLDWQTAVGACEKCHGLGNVAVVDENKVMPKPHLSITKDVIKPWSTDTFSWLRDKMVKELKSCGVKVDHPFDSLSSETKKFVWTGEDPNGTFKKISADFVSLKSWFDVLEAERYKPSSRILLAKYRKYVECVDCHGMRLKKAGLNATCRGQAFYQLLQGEIGDALNWLRKIEKDPALRQKLLSLNDIYQEVVRKLEVLKSLGLGTASLLRRCRTLSGGEYQRVLLARVIGNGLTDALYVLDEPSVGLGSEEIPNLIDALKQLRDLGNTILMVEHDPKLIASSDNVVELGPGGGSKGGNLLPLSGSLPRSSMAKKETARFEKKRTKVSPEKRLFKKHEALYLEEFSFLNCQNLKIEVPFGKITVVTGPSGAGKSTVMRAGLQAALDMAEDIGKFDNREDDLTEAVGTWKCLHLPEGFFGNYQVVSVEQKAMHRVISSVPATVLGLMDLLRKNFASSDRARQLGLGPSDFSFNGAGACETCTGRGMVKDDLFFLGQVDKQCPDCNGSRYRPPVLEAVFLGRSISAWLDSPIEEFYEYWKQIPGFTIPLRLAIKMGLGHLPVGVPTTMLSGGEAQRLRICAAIAKSTLPMFCLLDEPSRGLSEADIGDLILSLFELTQEGHTFVIVEHHEAFINVADQVLLMGPGGGRDGGKIVGRELVV